MRHRFAGQMSMVSHTKGDDAIGGPVSGEQPWVIVASAEDGPSLLKRQDGKDRR